MSRKWLKIPSRISFVESCRMKFAYYSKVYDRLKQIYEFSLIFRDNAADLEYFNFWYRCNQSLINHEKNKKNIFYQRNLRLKQQRKSGEEKKIVFNFISRMHSRLRFVFDKLSKQNASIFPPSDSQKQNKNNSTLFFLSRLPEREANTAKRGSCWLFMFHIQIFYIYFFHFQLHSHSIVFQSFLLLLTLVFVWCSRFILCAASHSIIYSVSLHSIPRHDYSQFHICSGSSTCFNITKTLGWGYHWHSQQSSFARHGHWTMTSIALPLLCSFKLLNLGDDAQCTWKSMRSENEKSKLTKFIFFDWNLNALHFFTLKLSHITTLKSTTTSNWFSF